MGISANRRNFLIASASAVGGAALWAFSSLPTEKSEKQSLVIGVLNPEVRKIYGLEDEGMVQAMNLASYIYLYELDARVGARIASPASMHQVSQLRSDPNTLVCAPKWAQKMMIVDKQSPQNALYLNAPDNFIYCGHFCEDPTGQFIFVGAQENRPFGRGHILVYSTRSWDLLQQYSTEHVLPHDMKMLDSGILILSQKHLISTKSNSPGLMSIFQVKDSNLSNVQHYPVEHSGHLTILADRRILIAGWLPQARKNGIYIFDSDRFSNPPQSVELGGFWGEPLNVVSGLDGEILAGFSDRKGFGSIRLMSPATGRYIHVGGLEIGAVTRVQDHIYFTEGTEGWLKKADIRRPRIQTYVGQSPVGFGTHGAVIFG